MVAKLIVLLLTLSCLWEKYGKRLKHWAGQIPREKLEWAARIVLEKKEKVKSTAIREMREEVKIMLEEKEQ